MNDNRNFVAPAPKPRPAQAYPISDAPAQVDRVFDAQEGAQEKTSGVDRSLALVIRMTPFTLVWGVLAVAVGWGLNAGVTVGFLAFAVLSALTFIYLDRQERDYSRSGLERFRIATAASLKRQEMAQTHELRRAALSQYIKSLEDKSHDA